MTFHERYLSGETITVYEDIYKLGEAAFQQNYITDIEKVLAETFKRATYNLEIIHSELKLVNYVFWKDKFQNEEALVRSIPNTDSLLQQLEETVRPLGYVPLSLKMFYRIVGSCDFSWNYVEDESILWEMADPIQIAPLEHLISQTSDRYWLEEAQEYLNDDEFGSAFLELAADDLHKDNVSGGAPYSLQLTAKPSIDSKFLNEPNDTTFIDYLRICFEHCGFPGISDPESVDGYKEFYGKVKPRLKMI